MILGISRQLLLSPFLSTPELLDSRLLSPGIVVDLIISGDAKSGYPFDQILGFPSRQKIILICFHVFMGSTSIMIRFLAIYRSPPQSFPNIPPYFSNIRLFDARITPLFLITNI